MPKCRITCMIFLLVSILNKPSPIDINKKCITPCLAKKNNHQSSINCPKWTQPKSKDCNLPSHICATSSFISCVIYYFLGLSLTDEWHWNHSICPDDRKSGQFVEKSNQGNKHKWFNWMWWCHVMMWCFLPSMKFPCGWIQNLPPLTSGHFDVYR